MHTGHLERFVTIGGISATKQAISSARYAGGVQQYVGEVTRHDNAR